MQPIGPVGDDYLVPANMAPAGAEQQSEPQAPAMPAIERRLNALEMRWAAKNGRDGADGRGIVSARQDEFGNLVLMYSDGAEENVGQVRADPAPAPSKLNFVRDSKTGRITKAELV